jgi:uncharacterized membrane protein YeaQ/YmgE (transglycosylase-associated protein family)
MIIKSSGGDLKMGLLLMLLLGAIAGYLASAVMHSPNGLVMDIILGVVGAFVGGFVMNLLGQPGFTGFNLYSLLVAFIGAVILIYLGRFFSHHAA